MTIKRELKPIISAMRSDEKYKRLKLSFDTLPIYQIAVDTILTEIGTAHKLRDIRRLNTSDPQFIDKIIKANTSDQSHRGRMTEILMTCLRSRATLERACTALKHHLLVTYSTELRGFRTKEERTYVIDMALSPFIRYIDRIQLLQDTANLVITDIDKGQWGLKLTVSALQMDRSRESNI
jgi:predicted secreted protein